MGFVGHITVPTGAHTVRRPRTGVAWASIRARVTLVCLPAMRELICALLLAAVLAGCGNGESANPPARVTTRRSAVVAASQPMVRPWKMHDLPDDQVNLIAFGDWGANDQQQAAVAEAMAGYVEKTGVQFHAALSAGDNIYVPVSSAGEATWQSIFEDMYDSRRLAIPFYMALGNHDIEEGSMPAEFEYARINPHSRWKLPARWYRVDFPKDRPLATVLVLDSNAAYMTRDEWFAQIRWMDEELSAANRGRWTIVMAHHPPFSNSSYGDSQWLMEYWGPLLEKHKVDFYISGHAHGLEHLQIAGCYTSFLISGAGGRGVRPMERKEPGPFSRAMFGFAHLQLRQDRALVRFIHESGRELHRFHRDADGRVTVEATIGTE